MLKQIQRLLCLLYVRTYFRHITLINDSKEHVGNLLIMSHRNGAIDGFVYHSVFPNTRFLLARQLQKNAFLRFFCILYLNYPHPADLIFQFFDFVKSLPWI